MSIKDNLFINNFYLAAIFHYSFIIIDSQTHFRHLKRHVQLSSFFLLGKNGLCIFIKYFLGQRKSSQVATKCSFSHVGTCGRGREGKRKRSFTILLGAKKYGVVRNCFCHVGEGRGKKTRGFTGVSQSCRVLTCVSLSLSSVQLLSLIK